MRIAIISDVHGNYPALKTVLKRIAEIGCDSIISLGDVVGYYCMINECIYEFRKHGIINLMGNHDSYLLGLGECPRSMTVNQCIEYQKKIIDDENLAYLRNSVIAYDDEVMSARHGGWNDPIDEYIDVFDFKEIGDSTKHFFCSGHTHKQKIQYFGNTIYFNPGSVGQPRDGDPRAAFAVIDNGNVILERIDYPIGEIEDKMRSEGFDDRLTECLYSGTKIRSYNGLRSRDNETEE